MMEAETCVVKTTKPTDQLLEEILCSGLKLNSLHVTGKKEYLFMS